MAGSTPVSLTAERPAGAGAAVAAAPRKQVRFSPGREAWRRFRKHRLAMMSTVILAFILAAVLLGPLVWRVAINEIDFAAKLQKPKKEINAALQKLRRRLDANGALPRLKEMMQ